MKEEYISLNEYCRRYKMGKKQVKYMCETGQLPYTVTENGYYKIRINVDMVPRNIHENIIRENETLKATIRNLQSILGQVRV